MSTIKDKLLRLYDFTVQHCDMINLAIVASVINETQNYNDFQAHSISTAYSKREYIEALTDSMQKINIYSQVFYDFVNFSKNFISLQEKPINIVFESTNKGIGIARDTLLPAYCDMMNIYHIGTNAFFNAICTSKYHWGSILKMHGISVPNTILFSTNEWLSNVEHGKQYLLKLNYECASIGLRKDSLVVNIGNELFIKAQELHDTYHQSIIAQEFIDGYEVSIPIIVNPKNTYILPFVGVMINGQENLKYNFLHFDLDSSEISYYNFEKHNPLLAHRIKYEVEKILSILDINSGYLRIDCRVKNDKFYFIDLNNDPCLDLDSAFMFSLMQLGINFDSILPILLGNALVNPKLHI